MDWIIRALIERLVGKGMEISTIPNYIKILARTISANNPISLEELNIRLESLGWDEFELDSHTLQLVMTIFENDDSKGCAMRETFRTQPPSEAQASTVD